MKKTVYFTLLCLALLLAPAGSPAGETTNDADPVRGGLGLRGWLSRADAKWRISFPYTTQAGKDGRIESELTFENIDSPMIFVTGGAGLGRVISLEVSYGVGSAGNGESTDTDRFVPASESGFDFSQSTSELGGDTRLLEAVFYYNNSRFTGPGTGPWGAVLGYVYYKDELRMTNGVQTLSGTFDGASFPPPGPFPSLDSTFDFTWKALKAGVLRQDVLSGRLSSTALLAFYPSVQYRGEGYWNLRTTGSGAFRAQSPNFIQESTQGYGYEATLGLTYALAQNMELAAGYRYFTLRAGKGFDRVYFADGSQAESTLDWAKATRQGAYVELVFGF
jgi:opacity protein-like surface antigen